MSGIYIHIPFCKQACHYCDFHFSTNFKQKDTLVLALAKELELRKLEFKDTKVETIYFGGGTPSVLPVKELDFIIKAVYKYYNVIENPEITLEANPDDLIQVKNESYNIYQDYLDIGINRLSIGVQSFFEADLKLMNRAHNAEEAKKCIAEAVKYFDNISIDLIYGIPNATNQQWLENIQKALSFGISHVSSYALTVEPKTALENLIAKGKIDNVNDELAQEQFFILKDELAKNGFEHYELSNFAKPGFYSKNNSAYWLGKPYIGIGPSAHSFNGISRSWNIKNNIKYIKSIQDNIVPNEIEVLTKNDRFNETVMTGLRTIWGISLDKIETNFGLDYKTELLNQTENFIKEQLLYIENSTIKMTKKGQFLCDGIASQLFKID
ncbi:radical SAM family heme chaperone HemW [Aurantibacter sp.]|uniref:radical SAM family heme chaperone HemW n=1 Tax=Aurantibacter sp. TaxID=2807103 RepID=UPI0035C86F8D